MATEGISNKDMTAQAIGAAGAAAGAMAAPAIADGGNLFPDSSSDSVSTTDRADTFTSSGGVSASDSAEMACLKEDLSAKQSVVDGIDDDISANETVKAERKADYTAANAAVTTALSSYNAVSQEYAAAQAALAELQNNSSILDKIADLFTQKIKAAQNKVNELKTQSEQAYKEYEEAVEQRDEAREAYADSIRDGLALKTDRQSAQAEVEAVQKQIQELSAKESGSTDETTSAEVETPDGTPEGEEGVEDGVGGEEGSIPSDLSSEIAALQQAAELNPELAARLAEFGENLDEETVQLLLNEFGIEQPTGAEIPATVPEAADPVSDTVSPEPEPKVDPSIAEDLALIENLKRDAQKQTEEFAKVPDISDFLHDVDRLVEIFCGELTEGEVAHLGFGIIDMVEEAAKIFESKLTAATYAKSGAMAQTDGASSKEHSEAESDFTDTVLNLSGVVNGKNVDFINVADKSNFELASQMLDRITQGEYIETNTLQKQTSVVKNIELTETSSVISANNSKYEEYSNAILSELNHLVSDSGQGMSEKEYDAIQAKYDSLAVKDPEGAFKYLEEQAQKYNIHKAVDNGRSK